jgi:2-polyprenyl-6-hydroxyphenyl methylase/3-demethylubiquinone-9 3-methyltransferase
MNLQSIYELSAEDWWNDRDGPMAPLHWMTPVRFAYFARAAGPLAGRDVLDLGCGGGLLAERFAAAGARVVGVDPLAACCRAAEAHARASALPIRYLRMGGERLGLADGSFDVVVAADVLEHVNDLPRVIAEVGRVLRPGGTFVFDTINRTWLARLVLVWLGERVLKVVPCGTHDPARFIRPAELKARLAAAGMQLRQTRGLGPVGWWGGRVRFGRLPWRWLSYLGWASKQG